jgi:SAM-dependent methyltransferase
VALENSIQRLSLPGRKSPYLSSVGSSLPIGKRSKLNRSSVGWAARFALKYFDLPEGKLRDIAGVSGREFLQEAWRLSGAAIYQMPEYALRQEWFHGFFLQADNRIPEQFYDAVTVSETILDWGCGTAEAERQDWIDRGRKTILMDLPGPNLEYTREKYRGYPVTTLSIGQDVVPKHCRGLICIDVLEHLERPIEAVKFLWDNLKPGGYAVIWFDPSYPHPGHFKESIAQIPAYDRWLHGAAIIHKRTRFDFVEKPRRWWNVL